MERLRTSERSFRSPELSDAPSSPPHVVVDSSRHARKSDAWIFSSNSSCCTFPKSNDCDPLRPLESRKLGIRRFAREPFRRAVPKRPWTDRRRIDAFMIRTAIQSPPYPTKYSAPSLPLSNPTSTSETTNPQTQRTYAAFRDVRRTGTSRTSFAVAPFARPLKSPCRPASPCSPSSDKLQLFPCTKSAQSWRKTNFKTSSP